MTPDDFDRLLGEWRAGSRDALGRLLSRYAEAVRAAVRARLNDRLRAEYDSLDFVQDVWASVARLAPGAHAFPTSDDLIGFLTTVARHKVIDATRRRLYTRKRDRGREERLPADADRAPSLRSREPSPSQWAIGAERRAALVARVPAGHRPVAELLFAGATHERIAELTGVNVRTVERVVRRLKELCAP